MSGADDTGSDFWSRRKAAVRKAEEAEKAQQEAADRADLEEKQAEKSDEEILEELGLPDPDTLTQEDDFSRFLSAAIPERLRRRALRRLWGLNPVLANLDGLVDYAEDYTDAATVVSNLQTVYQVGKGMFDKFAEEVSEELPEDTVATEVSKSTLSESSSSDAESENTAVQNTEVKNISSSNQLTQGDNIVQAASEGAVHPDLERSIPTEIEQESRATRRRIRFDYS